MYGNPQQGYMPDFKPDDQAISKPSPDTPSGDGFLLPDSDRRFHCFDCLTLCHDCPHFPAPELPSAALALMNRITCEGCE